MIDNKKYIALTPLGELELVRLEIRQLHARLDKLEDRERELRGKAYA